MKKLHSIFLEPSRTNGLQPLVNLPFDPFCQGHQMKTSQISIFHFPFSNFQFPIFHFPISNFQFLIYTRCLSRQTNPVFLFLRDRLNIFDPFQYCLHNKKVHGFAVDLFALRYATFTQKQPFQIDTISHN